MYSGGYTGSEFLLVGALVIVPDASSLFWKVVVPSSVFALTFSSVECSEVLRPPSFFLTNRTGDPHGDLVGQMNLLHMFSSINSQSMVSLVGESE